MMQPYLAVKPANNDNTGHKNEPANFIPADDIYHNMATGKTYLATESDDRKKLREGSNDSMIMLDIFGALNY